MGATEWVIEVVQTNTNPRGSVTPTLRTAVVDVLSTHIPESWVRERAKTCGVVQRTGKIDPYALVMVVLLGLVLRGPTTIAQLGQVYCRLGGISLARSAFWSRMSPSLATLMWEILERVMDKSRAEATRPPGVLGAFRDVIAVDASVIKVNDKLRSVWKGTRRNSAKAALKVHAWVRVFTGELVKARITADAHADSKALGVDHQLRGVLVLFDRGYASPSLWRRIHSVGGYFLCRVPKGWNQQIVVDHRRSRGRARKLTGLRLREAFVGLHRPLADVGVVFECRVRAYAGGEARKVKETFRVVAVRHPDTGEYALYATNAPPAKLAANDIREVYRLRWEVETFFKLGKSGSGMNELPSSKEAIVRLLLTAGLLRATLSMRSKSSLLRRFAPGQVHKTGPLQWVRWWNQQLPDVLRLMLFGVHRWRPRSPTEELLALLDPNHRHRPPTRMLFAEGV